MQTAILSISQLFCIVYRRFKMISTFFVILILNLLYLQVFFVVVVYNREEDRHENVGVYEDVNDEENSKETTVVVGWHPRDREIQRENVLELSSRPHLHLNHSWLWADLMYHEHQVT